MEKRVVLLKADGTEQVLTPEKKPDLRQMQEWVGGYIEPLHIRYDGRQNTMVVNEEGLLKRLPKNEKASAIAQRLIVGDVFILQGWRL